MNEETSTLDRARIEVLLGEILRAIKAHYAHGPISPERVLEALNALAAAAALVIRGAEANSRSADTRPEEFFRKALDQHLLDREPL